MKPFRWSPEKNQWLLANRGVGFEDVVVAISEGRLIEILDHPNVEKYERQKILLIEMSGYVYGVPMVENEREWFLKTIYPSRTFTRKYLRDD